MPIVGQNLWADAGNFGQGVGQTLGQALLMQPQLRAQLAMQQQANMQRQQQWQQEQAMAQQQQRYQQQHGDQELGLRATELGKQTSLAEKQLAIAQKQLELAGSKAQAGKYQPKFDKNGKYLGFGEITDKGYKWNEASAGEPATNDYGPYGNSSPQMGMPQSSPQAGPALTPPTQNQGLERLVQLLNIAARMRAGGAETNSMAPQYNMATNALAGLGQQLPMGQRQAGMTNVPPQLMQLLQQRGMTNAPAMGGMPQTPSNVNPNDPLGLGL